MHIVHSLKVANVILAILDVLRPDKGNEMRVEPYMNGRERGWSVQVSNQRFTESLKVSFSENRNSDSIVVYWGTFDDFDMNNIPAEVTYKKARYFSPEDFVGAAKFILSHLFD